MDCQAEGGPRTVEFQVMSTSWAFIDWTGWFPVTGGEVADVVADLQNGTTDVEIVAAVQYAAVRPERPGAPAIFTSASGTSSQSRYRETLSVGSQMWARVGIAARLSSTATVQWGQGCAQWWWSRTSCGRRIGSVVATVNPSPSTNALVIPVGPRLATVGVTAIKAGILIEGLSGGSLKDKMVVRLFDDDPESPGAWQDLETYHTASGDTGRNTTALAVSGVTGFSSAMWFETAVMIEPQDADIQATIKVHAVAKL